MLIFDLTKQIMHVTTTIISNYAYFINTYFTLPLNELELLFNIYSQNSMIIDNTVAINFARFINTWFIEVNTIKLFNILTLTTLAIYFAKFIILLMFFILWLNLILITLLTVDKISWLRLDRLILLINEHGVMVSWVAHLLFCIFFCSVN